MAVLAVTLLLLFSLPGSILAAPASTDRGASFSLPAIHRKGDSKLRKRATGNVVASMANIDDFNEFLYTCPVLIGGQTMNLHFDSGSTVPWSFSTSMPPDGSEFHNFFDPSLSSTYKDLGSRFTLSYVDSNTASGEWGSDTMNVGGIIVSNQAFGVADTVSDNIVTGPSDGTLGLSYSATLPGINQPSFLGNALRLLDGPVFAAYLPYHKDGAFDFGATDASRYTGDILYTPVDDPEGLWKFPSSAYKVDGVDHPSPGVFGMADTGADFIYMQASQVTTYYDAVPNSEYSAIYDGYIYPCGQALPSISFQIGPTNYATIPGANLITGFRSDDGTQCLGGVQTAVTADSVNLYGLLFFSAYYGVFDTSVPQFGFADIVVPP